jgi:3-ketosteroid 9alpha-monooxygenase subunit B
MPSYELSVLDVVADTDDAVSVSFTVPTEAAEAFAYRPGQFLTLAVPDGNGGSVARSYSLSSSPFEAGPLTVAVKRTLGGYASNWICDNLRPGAGMRALPPSGSFTPHNFDQDMILFAGGSGITPIMSIIKATLNRGRGRLTLFYANRDQQSVIFADALADLAKDHPARLEVEHWLESDKGLPAESDVRAVVDAHQPSDAFVCGPAPFMDLVIHVLRAAGVPRERRHQEVFVSIAGDPFAYESPVAVDTEQSQRVSQLVLEFEGETHRFDDWPATMKLLDFVESKGLRAPYSCREGDCSTCEFQLLEGKVELVANAVLDEEDLSDGVRLACQALPLTREVKARYL